MSEKASGGSTGVSFGYSHKAVIDFNFGYAKEHSSTDNAITVGISYYLSNQTSQDDETSAISLILQNGSDNTNFGFAFSLAHNFFFFKSILLQPSIGLSIYPSYKRAGESKTLTVASAGLSMGWRTDSGHSFALMPTAGYQEGNTFLGMTVIIVIHSN
jgi:hypothetical protein